LSTRVGDVLKVGLHFNWNINSNECLRVNE
jgi:hypothetical protein